MLIIDFNYVNLCHSYNIGHFFQRYAKMGSRGVDQPMEFMHRTAEEKIIEAIRRGEFDNLPGTGQPLPDDELKNVPEELRVGFRQKRRADSRRNAASQGNGKAK